MKIEAFTASPKQLVAAIDKAMNEKDLKTWGIVKNSQGDPLYTHIPHNGMRRRGLFVKRQRIGSFLSSNIGRVNPSRQ